MLILVQGPFIANTKYLVKDLAFCFPNYQIIVSCYEKEVENNYFSKFKNIKIINNADPGSVMIPPRGKPMNLKRQAKTIYKGCLNSDEEWVMKIRSDLKIADKNKFLKAINRYECLINEKKFLRIITLDNGSLDIFSYYDMLFHFNDWFFICRRRTLLENCLAISNIDEEDLVKPFQDLYPKNYFHFKKYRMLFHNEQLIHFGKQFLGGKTIKYCCQNNTFYRLKHLIWVAKYLRVVPLRKIGLKSSKVGYPSLRTKLAAISFYSWELHFYVWKTRGITRKIIVTLLRLHGYFRKLIFILLMLKNRLRSNFFRLFKKYLQNIDKFINI